MLKPLSWDQSDSKVASLKVFASIRCRQTQHLKVLWIHNQDVGLFATAKQVAINVINQSKQVANIPVSWWWIVADATEQKAIRLQDPSSSFSLELGLLEAVNKA